MQVTNTDGATEFRGFLVQARNEEDERIGTFIPTEDTNQDIVSCSASTFEYPSGVSE